MVLVVRSCPVRLIEGGVMKQYLWSSVEANLLIFSVPT
jgi:hypothetical protein